MGLYRLTFTPVSSAVHDVGEADGCVEDLDSDIGRFEGVELEGVHG